MSAIAIRTPDPDDDLTPEQRQARIEELKERLVGALAVTAQKFVEVGEILRELDDLGADTSDLKMWWIHYVRKVAYGQLLPGLVVRYFGNRKLLGIAASLPLHEQRLLASGEGVKLLTYSPDGQLALPDGKPNNLMVQPLDMTKDQLRQAFASDHIRSLEEQAAWLADKRTKAKGPKPEKVGKFNVDRARGGATHRGEFITLDELLAVVRELRQK